MIPPITLPPATPTRVIIGDTSLVRRRLLKDFLEKQSRIRVIYDTDDGIKLAEIAAELEPDILIIDCDIKNIDIVTLTRYLVSRFHTRIIIVSGNDIENEKQAMRALAAGATGVIQKQSGISIDPSLHATSLIYLIEQISPLTQVASREPEGPVSSEIPVASTGREEITLSDGDITKKAPVRPVSRPATKVVLFGASAGGPAALSQIFSSLPGKLDAAFCVVVHLPGRFPMHLAEYLSSRTDLLVHLAAGGEVLQSGHVYIAPSGKHLKIITHRKEKTLLLSSTPGSLPFIPSIDILFSSAAGAFGSRCLGILLSGMGEDGAKGLEEIKKQKGHTICQDSMSSIAFGMPGSAIRRGVADEILPVSAISEAIQKWAGIKP